MEKSFNKVLKKFFCLCLIIGQLVLLTGCSIFKNNPEETPKPDTPVKPDKPASYGEEFFGVFDTVSRIYSYSGETPEGFEANYHETASLLNDYHELFDIYHEYSGKNNLCTLNKNAGKEDPITLDPKLIEFLNYTKEIYTLTNGENNVMLGSVLKLWHDAREFAGDNPGKAYVPSMTDLQEAAKHTSIDLLEIDTVNNTARITDPKASIDVGAIGKGYATEKAAQNLEAKGLTSYVLNIGGNIRIIGTKPDGTGWKTGITDPFNKDYGYSKKIILSDTACVTSGNYERYFVVDKVKYHHIIDKDTLMPSKGFASITIITKDSGLADALSTALFSMTYEEGLALVNSLNEQGTKVDVLWVFENEKMKTTQGFDDITIK